jgi:hypothetical protein
MSNPSALASEAVASDPATTAEPKEPTPDEPVEALEDEEDEEDNFFTSIETSAAAQSKEEQPSGHDASHAPQLLRDAITKGEVDVDESEAESEAGGKVEEKKGEEHVHHRVSWFVCLLGGLMDEGLLFV